MFTLKLRGLLVTALFLSSVSFAQIGFQNGYFIDTGGVKTGCLIRNIGWIYNPSYFEYKLLEDGPRLRKEVTEVKEFAIGGRLKYVSAKVKIDFSTDALDDNAMSNSFAPEWREKHLFLKVQQEGDAVLLSYEDHDMIRFFYQVNGGAIEQLVFKRYKTAGATVHSFNNTYQQQLFTQVNCRYISLTKLEDINYEMSALRKWFKKHNACKSTAGKSTAGGENKQKWFFPKLVAGAAYLSYKSAASINTSTANVQYDAKLSPVFGAELEGILPFNNNKWSGFIEATSLSYKSTGKNSNGSLLNIDFNTINILTGLRHHFFLTDKAKLFSDISFVKDIKQRKIAPAAGMGFNYAKLTAQLRYFFNKGVYHNYFDDTAGGRFNNIALTAKYTVF